MSDNEVPPPPEMPDLPSDDQAHAEEQEFVDMYAKDQLDHPNSGTGDIQPLSIVATFPPFNRFDVSETLYPATDKLILCEGDSWFRHPFLVDIPECLMRMKYSVYNSNQPGRTLAESYTAMQYYVPRISEARKQQFKGFLISGGGNDMIGWNRGRSTHSPIFQNGGASNRPSDYINDDQVDSALNFLERTFDHIKQLLHRNGMSHTKVFLHCYDLITPRHSGGNGFKKFLPGGGPWIDKQLDHVCSGQRNQALRADIVHYLQKNWQKRYENICDSLGWKYVNLNGIVAGRWQDEIHPGNHAFWDVSKQFWTDLHKAGVTPSR